MVEEDAARVPVMSAIITNAVASGFLAIARVVVAAIGGRPATERHAGHFNLAGIAVAVTRIHLVEHAVTSLRLTARRMISAR